MLESEPHMFLLMLPATACSHSSQMHTLLQPDETNESSEPLPPAYKCLRRARHTHNVHSCSQAHAHSLTPLTPFARVFCVCPWTNRCPNIRSPLLQDKVGERGNIRSGPYYHIKCIFCDRLRLHISYLN